MKLGEIVKNKIRELPVLGPSGKSPTLEASGHTRGPSLGPPAMCVV